MIELLNPQLTYVLGCVENTKGARTIQEMSQSSLPVAKRWSHCAALFVHNSTWQVIEARPIFGCHMLSLTAWVEAYIDDTVEAVFALPVPLDIRGMFAHVGKDFAYRYMVGWKNGVREPKPDCYVFCSEILRRHDCGVLRAEPNDCTPADYQEFALQAEVPLLKLFPIEEYSVPFRMQFDRLMEG